MPDSSYIRPTPFRTAIRWLLVAAWCGVIFAASHQPDLRVSDDDLLDLVLRKGAHLGVYALLATFIGNALRNGGPWGRRTMLTAWLTTLAWAVSDEWHQTFIEGRVGHASDVAIDMLGATLALLALHLIVHRTHPSTSQSRSSTS